MRNFYVLILIISILGSYSCAISNKQIGVENNWRDPGVEELKIGSTTESDVLELFGPPSQIINLDNKLVFYYLLENTNSKKLILLFYNNFKEKSIYDRAIFFFDKEGVLTEYSYSQEKVPYEKDEEK